MIKTNFVLICSMLALTSCQFNYTLPDPSAHKESSVTHDGYHGAHGCAYKSSMEAAFLAKDIND